MTEMVRILSEGGIGFGTRVLDANGQEIPGVSQVQIKIVPDDVVVATVDIHVGAVDVSAVALLSENSLRAAADHYGFDLVRRTL